ncbi:MAG: hypothetical protein HY882_11255 [Deltaproteobacteria bacterium]|nr:hypothetical protein [Deltaproteobacteria bacterium]
MSVNPRNPVSLKPHGLLGLSIMGASGILLFSGLSFVSIYFTPLVWSGYILFIDSIIFRRKGASLILTRPREFALMLPLSIFFWLVFEFYNLYIQNWHYVGLPEAIHLRWLGYAWAFATIWPAILETAEALAGWQRISSGKIQPLRITKKHLFFSFIFGVFCLAFPLIVSPNLAKYLAAPVWLGFIFFLDPLNYWMGRKSLFRDLEGGDLRVLYSLLLSGFLCGLLWEFWNYWAGAKWYYTIPILGNVKIFEMPVLGYLGFPPFAVECYVMYCFVRNIFTKRANS